MLFEATLQSDGNSVLVQTNTDVRLTSFDWHPTHNNRLIVIGDTGALADVRLAERTAIVSIKLKLEIILGIVHTYNIQYEHLPYRFKY